MTLEELELLADELAAAVEAGDESAAGKLLTAKKEIRSRRIAENEARQDTERAERHRRRVADDAAFAAKVEATRSTVSSYEKGSGGILSYAEAFDAGREPEAAMREARLLVDQVANDAFELGAIHSTPQTFARILSQGLERAVRARMAPLLGAGVVPFEDVRDFADGALPWFTAAFADVSARVAEVSADPESHVRERRAAVAEHEKRRAVHEARVADLDAERRARRAEREALEARQARESERERAELAAAMASVRARMARGERVSPGQRDRLKQWDAEQAEVRRREAILAADERWLHPASKPVVVGVASGAAAETEV